MEQYFLWAQIAGFIAMCFSLTAWQLKKQEHILMCYVPSSFFWSVQFYLLGSFNGALFCLLCIFKDSALIKSPERYLKYVVGIFFTVNVIAVGIFYKSAFDLLPLLVVLFVNLPLMKKDNRYWVARGNIGAQICWIIFNLHAGAYMGLVCATFIITSSLIGMARIEGWEIGKCYKTFAPSIARSLFLTPRTFP